MTIPAFSPATSRVAFLGLGVMGLPMAKNIAEAGFDLVAYDISTPAREHARDAGLIVTDHIASALPDADIVITMLPDTPNVVDVVTGRDGLVLHCRPGTLYVDMSSISPMVTRELAATLTTAGIRFVDAPVSGGVKGATAGTLSVMAGGSRDDLAAAMPVLESMSQTVTHMGEVGTGQATKACNQIAVAINIQAVCEAFTLGRRLGVDLRQLRSALMGGSTASWVLDNLGPQMIAGDDAAGFRIALQVKDLRLALDAAQSTATPLPAASGVLDMYLEAMAHDEGSNGNQALSRVYERLANVSIAE